MAICFLFKAIALFAAICVCQEELLPCGHAFYSASRYTCYDGDFLCPVLDGVPTLRCGPDCYLPSMYSCANGHLLYPPTPIPSSSPTAAPTTVPTITGNNPPECPGAATTLELDQAPYSNYFYSDCNTAAQVVVTSPRADSNLTLIGPRLIVSWPAGNSGIAAFFAPSSGRNGSLAIRLDNSTTKSNLSPVYIKQANGGPPSVGVSGILEFNSSAVLTLPILGSVRTIRDFTEGPSLLREEIQSAIETRELDSGVALSRLWLDNVTTTEIGFLPVGAANASVEPNNTVNLSAGSYVFYARFNYPQLEQLSASRVLSPQSQNLITQQPDQTTSLSFFSYTNKLLAGGWRFLTYFGRDSMIAALLLEPVLSQGEGGAIEAVIGAVLERINRTDGSVSHEETLGDYATYLNAQDNITSTDPTYTYQMIDTDYYLPVLMQKYLNTANGSSRLQPLLGTPAGKINPANANLTWGELAQINAEKIMTLAGRYAAKGNQTRDNLIHLKEDQIVGEWRDSTYGIGGGRIPYDVNTALVPAALRSIAALSRASFFSSHHDWATLADTYAQVWEDTTLEFFEVSLTAGEAQDLVNSYVLASSFPGPANTETISGNVTFHALALDGYNNLSQVAVMNTDDCFRHFLLNTTDQRQLSSFLNQTASNINRVFPAGLMSSVGLLVANPAFGNDPVYARNFTTSAYHGTVVWSWQQAMMARGLELQLARCGAASPPDFCADAPVRGNVRRAYNALWDVIDANRDRLSGEVWSWRYVDGDFAYADLGALPPPAGTSPTESDVRQLWSLTFLAVTRDENLRS